MSIETRTTKAGKAYYFVRVKSGRELVATNAFDTQREAKAWERDQKHRLETGRPLLPHGSFTLGALVTMFLVARANGHPHTVDTDRNNVEALPKALLMRPLGSIHTEDIRSHLLAQLHRGKKPSTVAREKTTLRALFTFADEQGLLHQPHPVQTMKKIPQLSTMAQRAISPKDVPSPPRLAAAIEAVHARRGTRAVPLSPRALSIFMQYAAGKDRNDYLFTNTLGGQLSVRVVRKFTLGFDRHALRHFTASTWLRLGTPVHEVAEYLGDDPRTVLAV